MLDTYTLLSHCLPREAEVRHAACTSEKSNACKDHDDDRGDRDDETCDDDGKAHHSKTHRSKAQPRRGGCMWTAAT